MSANMTPNDMLDRASLHLFYAGQFIEMLSEIALQAHEKEDATDLDNWMVDKVYALTHALRELLQSSKKDVDDANSQQAWDRRHEVINGHESTPTPPTRRKSTSIIQPLEQTA